MDTPLLSNDKNNDKKDLGDTVKPSLLLSSSSSSSSSQPTKAATTLERSSQSRKSSSSSFKTNKKINNDNTMIHNKKQGGKCCGNCCDFRRAVIITDVLYMIFAITGVLFATTLYKGIHDMDDGEMTDLLHYMKGGYKIQMIVFAIGTITSGIAMMGAIKFKKFFVLVQILWFVIQLFSIVYVSLQRHEEWKDRLESQYIQNPTTILTIWTIGTMLIIYPHYKLKRELARGIMTRETYRDREAYSCCCMS